MISLFRAHYGDLHRLREEDEEKANEAQADQPADQPKQSKRKRRRTEEKKLADMPLLEFTRQVVEVAFKAHSTPEVMPQAQVSSRPSDATLEVIRYDGGPHLPKLTEICGVCRL